MRPAILFFLLATLPLAGQDTIVPVYPGDIPCFTEGPLETRYDSAIGRVVTSVTRPELHYYAPVPRTQEGKAVMIIPGGGYVIEAWDLEGTDIARYLAAQGIHAFVLSHRLPMRLEGECKSTAALSDAQQGMLRVKELADRYGFAPDQVGIMGFSAGGHLAGSASVHPRELDGLSSRPDYSILVYPVLIMNESRRGHRGSQQNLLGDDPDADRLAYFNLPERVDSLTPPALLIHASDDGAVAPENSLRYYSALVAHGVPADLRVYATGGHGFGAARERGAPVSGWLEEVTAWIATQ